ncbi:hypothetical protein A3A74_00485 [Candidatus Roizmanbacteria bacterium RIFCSPLOWO2_01_FULL_35_13]|uniref:Uncharacterized protein n=1 Tax=Candidatus Roizmanbacteria bacterium RIFCSPLOWO2_01_FULL_35_13 TaxID=1802055 RepID=A0A1F7IBC8_9BACT|nr:MAG: hypothetical protein A3A74_00485 [Candidatus Roizmanbacteria bacterium RIFCSPLOWO2_01_FULL_35_13]
MAKITINLAGYQGIQFDPKDPGSTIIERYNQALGIKKRSEYLLSLGTTTGDYQEVIDNWPEVENIFRKNVPNFDFLLRQDQERSQEVTNLRNSQSRK